MNEPQKPENRAKACEYRLGVERLLLERQTMTGCALWGRLLDSNSFPSARPCIAHLAHRNYH